MIFLILKAIIITKVTDLKKKKQVSLE